MGSKDDGSKASTHSKRSADSKQSGQSGSSAPPGFANSHQLLQPHHCSAIFTCRQNKEEKTFVCFRKHSECRRPGHRHLSKAACGDHHFIQKSTQRCHDGSFHSRLSPKEFKTYTKQREEEAEEALRQVAGSSPWKKTLNDHGIDLEEKGNSKSNRKTTKAKKKESKKEGKKKAPKNEQEEKAEIPHQKSAFKTSTRKTRNSGEAVSFSESIPPKVTIPSGGDRTDDDDVSRDSPKSCSTPPEAASSPANEDEQAPQVQQEEGEGGSVSGQETNQPSPPEEHCQDGSDGEEEKKEEENSRGRDGNQKPPEDPSDPSSSDLSSDESSSSAESSDSSDEESTSSEESTDSEEERKREKARLEKKKKKRAEKRRRKKEKKRAKKEAKKAKKKKRKQEKRRKRRRNKRKHERRSSQDPPSDPSSSDDSSTSSSSGHDSDSDSTFSTVKEGFCAVVCGRRDYNGAVDDKRLAKELRTKGAVIRKFPTEQEAETFVQRFQGGAIGGGRLQTVPSSTPPMKFLGKDPSCGKDEEFFDISLDLDAEELRDELNAPGMPADIAKECVEAMKDAFTPPGKQGPASAADDTASNIQDSLNNLVNLHHHQVTGHEAKRDFKWSKSSANGFRDVEAPEDLEEPIKDTESIRHIKAKELTATLKAMLRRTTWSKESCAAWAMSGPVTALFMRSIECCLGMLQNVKKVAEDIGWEIAHKELQHCDKRAGLIRVSNRPRSHALIRLCILFRDSHAKSWKVPKLEADKVKDPHQKISCVPTGGGSVPEGLTKLKICKKCGTVLHGSAPCPWSSESNADAKKAGRDTMKAPAEKGSESQERMIERMKVNDRGENEKIIASEERRFYEKAVEKRLILRARETTGSSSQPRLMVCPELGCETMKIVGAGSPGKKIKETHMHLNLTSSVVPTCSVCNHVSNAASAQRDPLRFGTVGQGLDLFRAVWTSEDHVFSCQDHDLGQALPHRPAAKTEKRSDQTKDNFLHQNPVDALLVDEGTGETREKIGRWMRTCTNSALPRIVVFAGPSSWLCTTRHINWRKERRKELGKRGCQALEWCTEGHHQGGALCQERAMEVCVLPRGKTELPMRPPPQGLAPREMRNLLRTFEVPRRDWPPTDVPLMPCDEDPSDPRVAVGTLSNKKVCHVDGCMPEEAGAWLSTEKGIRRLQPEELAKGMGMPGEWRNKDLTLSARTLEGTTSLHTWTVVGDAMGQFLSNSSNDEKDNPGTAPQEAMPCRSSPLPPNPLEARKTRGRRRRRGKERIRRATSPASPAEAEPTWNYELPDLSEGGAWCEERVANLKEAIAGRDDAEELCADGLDALRMHRENHTEAGPKCLQVPWWEFPERHGEAVRIGSSVRFLVDPGDEMVPNPPLTDEQVAVVEEFVDELISLGVLREATRKLRRACPIFVVPKPGQPGQWRCTADVKRGGQNECCSLDPICLPTSRDTLPHPHEGGWSGVADASECFHNHPALDNERDLIGAIHPTTGEHHWHVGLPMGSVCSPSISCRIGEGILGSLRERHSVFKTVKKVENTWRTALDDGSYQKELGHGCVGLQDNGRPVALMCACVDDFFMHASTLQDCAEAMTAFMDIMMRLGLICQKVKTSPPSQTQKHCGFVYDCTESPRLMVPANKASRCLASVDFLLSRPRSALLSRLSLAVVTGVLQSTVEATPQRFGQSHPRELHNDLHVLEERMDQRPHEKCHASVELSTGSTEGLIWWREFLHKNPGAYTTRSTTGNGILVKWGDGSGTGTGGTTEDCPMEAAQMREPNIELWMGVWKAHVKPTSSNWKEARTVLEALRQERGRRRVTGKTVFYVTDNLVSHYIINGGGSRIPSPHEIVMEIKALELELGCRLEVVHVPGTLMIVQGTDGLSRGLWFAPERRMAGINQRLFQKIQCHLALGIWAMEFLHLPGVLPLHLDYQCEHDMSKTWGRWTIWRNNR